MIEELNKNQQVKGTSTWELDDEEFTASYQWGAPYYTTHKVRGTFEKSKGKLSGYWGYDDSDDDGEMWVMSKND